MRGYLESMWQCRYFWLSLVKIDLRARYRRSIIGVGWSLLHPVALTIILCTVFPIIFNISVEEYGTYLMAGLAFWSYVVSVTTQGSQCFFQGECYIRQHPTPLAIYPLRTALGGTIHFFMALATAIVLACIFRGLDNLPYLVYLIPALALLFVLVWSLALLAGFCNVYFQDTQHLLEIGFQFLFYATPIIYPEAKLRENNLSWLVDWNPMVPFVQLIRTPILDAQPPSLATFGSATLITFVVFSAAVLTLSRLQKRLIFRM